MVPDGGAAQRALCARGQRRCSSPCPQAVPLIGGPVTLEALVYGALNGLVLTGLFTAFAVFNRVTPVRALIRLAPRAYYPVAVTVAIAVTFVPVTLRQAGADPRGAGRARPSLRGLRSWVPLFLPLLSSGLERALQLAEAMVARGFAHRRHPIFAQRVAHAGAAGGRADPAHGGGGCCGLPGAALAGRSWLLLAGLLLLGGVRSGCGGREHPHTVYRKAPWRAADWAVAGRAPRFTAALFLLPLPGVDRSSLAWYPYPTLTMPGVSLLLGLATWGCWRRRWSTTHWGSSWRLGSVPRAATPCT